MANKDDLLNLNNKKSMKKPLIYGAIAFLIFIIGVLGYAIYSNNSKSQDNVVIPPQVQKQKQQDSMFKEVPIEEESKNSQSNAKKTNTGDENLAQKLLKKENNTSSAASKNVAVQTAAVNKSEKNSIKTESPAEKVNQKTSNVSRTNTVKIKPVIKVKTAAKSKVKYYVQVAALMKYKKPNKKFLELIKKEGYTYKLYETYYIRNGKKIEVLKVLVGPFHKNNVRKELRKIKNTITQNAFIFKVR